MMTRPDDEMQDVLEQLGQLAPGADDAPRPPGQMLAQIKVQINQPSQSGSLLPGRIRRMFKRQYVMISGLVLLFALAFTFPTVRAAASDFLGLFRVRKFAAISISPRQLAMLEEMAESGFVPGELEILSEPDEFQWLDSPAEAAGLVDHAVRSPAALEAPDSISVGDGGQGRLQVNLEDARSLLELAELDPQLLPDTLDGAVIDVTLFPSIEMHWRDQQLRLLQTRSPEINYPPDVDPTVLGRAALQLLGMTEREAGRLANRIDWNSTVLLPVPEGIATFSEISVDGQSGLGLSNVQGTGSILMWERDGIVYLLTSNTLLLEDLRRIGNSLQ